MIIGYARVSSQEQSESEALDQQVNRLKKAGASRVFSDVESGRKDNRKQFNQMMLECENKQVTEIIITRIDRLGRSIVTLHRTLKRLEELGVRLNILDMPVESDSLGGWMMISQLAVYAEFESRMLQERVNHGMDYFRETQKANVPPFGFIRNDFKYEIDPKTFKIALEIIDKFMSCSLRQTVIWLQITHNIKMTAYGLRYWLTNPVLVGDTRYKHQKQSGVLTEQIIPNTHKGLITRERQAQILERLQTNKSRYAFTKGPVKSEYPLCGLMFCVECGGKCFKVTRNRVRCYKHDQMGGTFCSNSRGVNYQDVIEQVNQRLIDKCNEISQYTLQNQPVESATSEETAELLALRQQIKSLESLPRSPVIDEAIIKTRRLIDIEISKQSQPLELPHSLVRIFSDENYWRNLADKDLVLIYKQFVGKVMINNGKVTDIILNF